MRFRTIRIFLHFGIKTLFMDAHIEGFNSAQTNDIILDRKVLVPASR